MNPTPDESQPPLFPEGQAPPPTNLSSWQGNLQGTVAVLTRKHLTLLRKIPGLSDLVACLESHGKIHRSLLTITVTADHAPTVVAVPRVRKRKRHHLHVILRLEADLVTPVPPT